MIENFRAESIKLLTWALETVHTTVKTRKHWRSSICWAPPFRIFTFQIASISPSTNTTTNTTHTSVQFAYITVHAYMSLCWSQVVAAFEENFHRFVKLPTRKFGSSVYFLFQKKKKRKNEMNIISLNLKFMLLSERQKNVRVKKIPTNHHFGHIALRLQG